MNDTFVSALVGVLCIAAVGMSATTLESSVSTVPDDVLDHDKVPISKEDAAALEREVRSDGTERTGANGGGEPGEGDEQVQAREKKQAQAQKQRADDSGRQQEAQQNRQRETGDGNGLTVEKRSWVDRLLAFLEQWWPVLLAVTVLVGLAYRYRERLAATMAALVPRIGRGERDDGPGRPWADAAPRDEVSRAWLALARRTDVDRPRARTVREYADAAVEQGLNPDAVETVTREFEAVRYRGADVTDDRERRARESRARMGDSRTDGGEPRTDGHNSRDRSREEDGR